MFLEIQCDPTLSTSAAKGERIENLLYPDHHIYEVGASYGKYAPKAFFTDCSEDVLVLPAELAGIIQGSSRLKIRAPTY